MFPDNYPPAFAAASRRSAGPITRSPSFAAARLLSRTLRSAENTAAWRPVPAGQSEWPPPSLLAENVRSARHDQCIVPRPASKRSFHAGETTPAPILCFHVRSDWWPRAGAAHTAPSDPKWIAVARRIRSAAFFLMPQQAAFDISWMNLRPKTLLDQTHQLRCPHGRLFLAHLDEKGQDLVG